jgi:hypothetical protein
MEDGRRQSCKFCPSYPPHHPTKQHHRDETAIQPTLFPQVHHQYHNQQLQTWTTFSSQTRIPTRSSTPPRLPLPRCTTTTPITTSNKTSKCQTTSPHTLSSTPRATMVPAQESRLTSRPQTTTPPPPPPTHRVHGSSTRRKPPPRASTPNLDSINPPLPFPQEGQDTPRRPHQRLTTILTTTRPPPHTHPRSPPATRQPPARTRNPTQTQKTSPSTAPYTQRSQTPGPAPTRAAHRLRYSGAAAT